MSDEAPAPSVATGSDQARDLAPAEHKNIGAKRVDPGVRELTSRRGTGLAVGLALIGAVLNLVGSGRVSLWKDEADTVSASTRSLPALWGMIHHVDAVHALYYVALHVWIDGFGRSPSALRALSAVAVAVAALGVYSLARELTDLRTALLATGCFVVLPRVTWMGIEARSFAWTAAFAAWAAFAFVRADRSGRRVWWVAYALLAGIGVAVNVYVGLLVVANGLSLLVLRRGGRRLLAWALAAGGALVLSAPVIIASLAERGQVGDTPVGAAAMLRSALVNQWFLGNTPTPDGQATGSVVPHHLSDLWRPAAIVLALVAWVLIVRVVARRWRTVEERSSLSPTVLLVPWILLPTIVVGGYSLVGSPMYSPRYFSFCTVPVAVLLALGLQALRPRLVRTTAALLMVVLIVPIYLSQRWVDGKGADWSQAAAYIAAHKGPDQAVYFVPRFAPTGTTVGRTMRYVKVAYPEDLKGLTDLTLLRTPTQDDSLSGRSSLLADVVGRLQGVRAVWVVRRLDYPASQVAADTALLERRGFARARSWRGSVDTVVEFVRS